MRFYLADDYRPADLLKPCRMDVFATCDVPVGKRGKVKRQGCGWQAWNADPIMEQRSARLPGAGSFYWPNAIQAVMAAKRLIGTDPSIHQITIETISATEIARIYVG